MKTPSQSTRTLFYNGSVRTIDPAFSRAEALAVQGERILAVGTTAEILDLARPGDTRINLRGRTLLPGFQDAHLHFAWHGLALQRAVLTGAATLAEALERVGAATRAASDQGWLLGSGWNHNLWPMSVRPTRYDLDQVVPARPVALTSKDGHSLWLNSAALRAAGIGANTPDPPGGQILRDASGEPTGIVTENVMEMVQRAIPRPSETALCEALRQAQAQAMQLGVTSIHNCEGPQELAAFQRLEQADELTVRVWHMLPVAELDAALRMGLQSGFGSTLLRIGHVKMFADGALGSTTAEMLAPYEDLPNSCGVAATSTEVLYQSARAAALGGLSSAIHAIGDAANRRVLDVYARLRGEGLVTRLPQRIEHVQLLAPTDLARLAALGVVASMQPIHAPQDHEMATVHWGARARYGYAWRSIMDSGALLILGTDCPVEALDPLANVYAAITRRTPQGEPAGGWYPQEALTLDEALYAYTLAPSIATGEAHLKGSLTPGKLADLVVLSNDIHAAPPEALLETVVDVTMLGGRVLYRRDGV